MNQSIIIATLVCIFAGATSRAEADDNCAQRPVRQPDTPSFQTWTAENKCNVGVRYHFTVNAKEQSTPFSACGREQVWQGFLSDTFNFIAVVVPKNARPCGTGNQEEHRNDPKPRANEKRKTEPERTQSPPAPRPQTPISTNQNSVTAPSTNSSTNSDERKKIFDQEIDACQAASGCKAEFNRQLSACRNDDARVPLDQRKACSRQAIENDRLCFRGCFIKAYTKAHAP